LYRAEDYAGSAEALADQKGPEARYNLGNALARAGRLEDALAAYDETLAAVPDHADARFNRDLVAKLLEQQKQQQPQPGQDGKKQDSQNQDGKKQDSQQGDQSGDSSQQPSAQNQDSRSQGQQESRDSEQQGEGSQPQPESAKEGDRGQQGSQAASD